MRLNDFYDNPVASESKQTKLVAVSAIIFSTLIIYILKLFSMQVVGGAEYRSESVKLASREKAIPAQRGEIYARDAVQPLATNVDSFAVDVVPGEIPAAKFDTVLAKLSAFLGVPKSQIERKLPPSLRKSFTAIEIKSNVPFSAITQIAENLVDLPGVSWRSKPMRNYIEVGSLAHIIGYVGNITNDELKVMYNDEYRSNSIIGKTGIERQYDKELQGKEGKESRTVDVRGREVSTRPEITPPEMGKNLVLTIDREIQTLAEQALGERIGSIVVLKPASGEVLAMASWPYYDTNIFTADDSGTLYANLLRDPNKPLINRAISANYPPASTFKVIMTTAAMQERVIDPAKKVDCKGFIDYGNRTFKCHVGIPGHGAMDMKNGLAQSCNVYFWTVGDSLGVDRISNYARQFGYGLPLGIDLPSSIQGLVPTAQWKERTYHEKWLGGDTLNMSIGQSYTLVTPLHVANMMAMIVNKGKIYRPHVLKEKRDPATNEIIEEIQPEVLHETEISQDVWNEVQAYLRYMVTNGSATYPLNNKVVQIAGKTGTAEIAGYKDRWHSWFVGYAPFDAPAEDAVVVCVSVEAANVWEWWGPYAANIVFQGIFAKQTYDEALAALRFQYLAKPAGRQE